MVEKIAFPPWPITILQYGAIPNIDINGELPQKKKLKFNKIWYKIPNTILIN